MKITINGNHKQLISAQSLSEIVDAFCKNPKHVITELNGSIVPSDQWAKVSLKEGDALELVTFVGGG